MKKWDSVERLQTEEDMVLYLNACLEEAGDDAAFVARAIGTIARARGMGQLISEMGLDSGDPSFAVILKIMPALGMRLQVTTAIQHI